MVTGRFFLHSSQLDTGPKNLWWSLEFWRGCHAIVVFSKALWSLACVSIHRLDCLHCSAPQEWSNILLCLKVQRVHFPAIFSQHVSCLFLCSRAAAVLHWWLRCLQSKLQIMHLRAGMEGRKQGWESSSFRGKELLHIIGVQLNHILRPSQLSLPPWCHSHCS